MLDAPLVVDGAFAQFIGIGVGLESVFFDTDTEYFSAVRDGTGFAEAGGDLQHRVPLLAPAVFDAPPTVDGTFVLQLLDRQFCLVRGQNS